MNTNWLADLAPEHAPAPPTWWPPAPGWWVLLGLAMIAAALILVWWRSPRRRLRRSGLRELARIRATELSAPATAQAVQNLLRRYALALYDVETVARLSGPAWQRFLAEHGAEAFRGAVGLSLLTTSYGGATGAMGDSERAAWLAAAEQFVRRAMRSAPRRQSRAVSRGLRT
jgi:hypothetical protein